MGALLSLASLRANGRVIECSLIDAGRARATVVGHAHRHLALAGATPTVVGGEEGVVDRAVLLAGTLRAHARPRGPDAGGVGLFSYKLNPQTVLFLGYSDNRLGLEGVVLTQTSRTYFLKIGYAWTL